MKTEYINVLVLTDGSRQAEEGLLYAASVLPKDRTRFTLFHVRSQRPDSLYDLDDSTSLESIGMNSEDWDKKSEDFIRWQMDTAIDLLDREGIDRGRVTVKIRNRAKGVARDIISECANQYHLVVMGRTGAGAGVNLPLGSVAVKLIMALRDNSLILVGGKPDPGSLVIGFDHSEGAKKCVTFAGSCFRGTSLSIHLVHVIRSMNVLSGNYDQMDVFSNAHQEKWQMLADSKTRPQMESAIGEFIEKGFDAKQLSMNTIFNVTSRAGALHEEAGQIGAGGIMVGRRGVSSIREFFMGRVGEKLARIAFSRALWIIS